MTKSTKSTKTEPNLELQRFYIKDVSFESPRTPQVFTEESEATTNIQINTSNNSLQNNFYEVIIAINITISNKSGTILLIELEQAGIFLAQNFPSKQIEYILHTYCANILFPYAREEISNLTIKGGFPPLLLAPVNFDILYEQKIQQNKSVTKH